MMTAKKARVAFLNHTADMGIRVTAPALTDLFQKAGEAVMDIMLRQRPTGRASPFTLSVAGDDLPDLMVRWLGEILFLFHGEGKLVTDMDIHSLVEDRIDATLYTVPFDPDVHEVTAEIKAVTYHQIEVARGKDGWQATVIFDL